MQRKHSRPRTLGQQILRRLHIRQTCIAEAIGVTQSTVSGWVRGEFLPEEDHRAALDRLYGIPKLAWTSPAAPGTHLPKRWPLPTEEQRRGRKRCAPFPAIAALDAHGPTARRREADEGHARETATPEPAPTSAARAHGRRADADSEPSSKSRVALRSSTDAARAPELDP